MTKGTARTAVPRIGRISGEPEKKQAISYFNQIISRTMGPTGEKFSFASCSSAPEEEDRCPRNTLIGEKRMRMNLRPDLANLQDKLKNDAVVEKNSDNYKD